MKIHPYTVFFYNLFVPCFLIYAGTGAIDIYFGIYSSLALLLLGKYKRLLKAVLYALVLYVLYVLTSSSSVNMLKFLGLMFAVSIRFLPCFMMASILIIDYNAAELLTSLDRLHLPKKFIIAVTITLRYFPIFRREFKQIKDSMRLRGISFTLLKPIQSFSYFIVPQLFRCMILAEELTGAGLTKGIESKQRRSSFYDLSFKALDGFLMALLVFGAVGVKLWLMH